MHESAAGDKQRVLAYWDCLRRFDFAEAARFVSPEAVYHGVPGAPPGSPGIAYIMRFLGVNALHEPSLTIGYVLAEGGVVAVQWAFTTSPQEVNVGMIRRSCSGLSLYRLENGMIMECWTALSLALAE